jgi:hypothetical protein
MKKNNIICDFIKNNCSSTIEEREKAQYEYNFLENVLVGSIFQSGSYARFTSITPLNDLDVIWVISEEVKKRIYASELKIENILGDLAQKIKYEYKSKNRKINVNVQSHSVTIEFTDRNNGFSIDIVPAYELNELNEYGDSLYKIPEIGLISKKKRQKFYENIKDSSLLNWIKSDPKGYIELAKKTNEKSPIFRLSTKLLKKWKRTWTKKNNFKNIEFKLKSFHIEIMIQKIIEFNSNYDVVEVLKTLLSNMNYYLSKPHHVDRAQDEDTNLRYIDQYVNELSLEEKGMILIAANSGLQIINKIRRITCNDESRIIELLNRLISGEEFIESYGFKITDNTIKNKDIFKIDGYVREKTGFPHGWLTESIPLSKGITKGINERCIDFDIRRTPTEDGMQYWKVRNTGKEALEAECLRGEININTTLGTPEKTAYKGIHYVICYLVNSEDKTVYAIDKVAVKII